MLTAMIDYSSAGVLICFGASFFLRFLKLLDKTEANKLPLFEVVDSASFFS